MRVTTLWGDPMLAARKLLVSTGVLVSVLGLAGCRQQEVASFAVSADGSVTIADVSTVTYDDTAGLVTVVKPDGAALLTAAKKGTSGFVGPGVSKPVVRLVRLSKHVLQLTVSQKMTSIALLNAHGNAFDPATLSLDVSPAKGAPLDPKDPFGLKGPRTEKVTVDAGDSSGDSSGDDDDSLTVKHVGHLWSFLISENAKDYAAEHKQLASLTATLTKAGLSEKALSLQIHVKLPGKVVATNGKPIGGGVVSWDLLHQTSPKLTLTTKD